MLYWLRRNFLIVLILLVATVLRCWNFFSIPLTYDEYSTLWRCSLGDAATVLREGVMRDAHPPLATMFVFYWTKFFGDAMWVVKLPFIIMGIFSVFLLYRVGQLWFSKTTGLLSAAWFAVLQEPVVHSQIARPYAMGVMWLLLAAVFLAVVVSRIGTLRTERGANTQQKTNHENRTALIGNVIAYGIFLALAAYTHHFAMLAAALLWCCGILFFRGRWKPQLVAGIIALVLYSPNLAILFAQLKLGGIGTVLATPTVWFLADYLYYIFHFSWWLIALAVVLSLSAFLFHSRADKKFLWTALILFFGTLLTGTLYSIIVAPVLQTRVMFFVLPFSLLSLFTYLHLKKGMLHIFVVAVLVAGCYSLAAERDYYNVFYKNGFAEVIEFAQVCNQEEGAQLNVLAYSPFILDYQKRNQDLIDMQLVNPDSTWHMRDYRNLVEQCAADRICLGWTSQYYKPPVEFLAMAVERFPVIENQMNWFNSSAYVFTYGDETVSTKVNTLAPCAFDKHWKVSDAVMFGHTDSLCSINFQPGVEFGVSYEGFVAELQNHRYDYLYAQLQFGTDSNQYEKLADAMLVMEVLENDIMVAWFGNRLADFVCERDTGITQTIHCGIDVSNSLSAYTGCYSPDVFRKPDAQYKVKAYIWNRGGSFSVEQMSVGSIPGNPLVYGLIE